MTTVLWLLPIVLLSAICYVMLRRKLVCQFPIFFCYTALVAVRGILLLFFQFGTSYFYIYWWGRAVAILLSLGVLFEIISHVLHSYPFLRLLVLRLISAVVAISFVIGVIFLITRRQADAGGFLLSVLSMERAARLLLVCLWILFTILVSRLGLTWQRYPLGIAAGFAFYAAVDLALLELRVGLNWIPDNFFVLLRSAAYNLAVGIWAYYFLHVRVQRPVEHLPSTDVGKWNHLLMHYVDQWYRRS